MIETFNLTKKFGDLVAVDSVNLKINKGEIFGLLGPNGAGKTTTISMLSVLIPPTEGNAIVGGFDITKNSLDVRKSIGIVFQSPSVDDLLSGFQNLELHGLLYGMDKKTRRNRIDEVLKLVELQNRADDSVKNYSGGMRKRIEIARGLMHHPKILFLDEPTVGLDPQTREHIWDYIQKLVKEENITVLLTTHYMEEAEFLCDRVGIIDYGKLIAIDSPKNLKSKLGVSDFLYLETDEDLNKLQKLDFVEEISKDKGSFLVKIKDAQKNLQKLLAQINNLKSIEVRKRTLNDVFIHYTGRGLRDEQGNDSIAQRIMNQRSGR